MNTQEAFLLASLLERVRDVVFAVPWPLPITVPVGSPFRDVLMVNREDIHGVFDILLVFLIPISQEVPARAIDNANVPV